MVIMETYFERLYMENATEVIYGDPDKNWPVLITLSENVAFSIMSSKNRTNNRSTGEFPTL